MKIKTHLILSASISVGLTILISVFFFFYLAETKQANKESQAASLLLKEIAELVLVTDDYLAYQYERNLQQWEIKYSKINSILLSNQSILKKIDPDIKSFEQSFRTLQTTFENKKQTTNINVSDWIKERNSILKERSQGRVRFYSNKIFADTFKIFQDAAYRANRLQKKIVTVFVGCAIFLISEIFFTYYLIIKKIAAPMKDLVNGTTIFGNGDLNYRIPLKKNSRDEFGHLIEQFNLMAVKLSQSGASLMENVIKYRQIYENIQDVYYEASLNGQILEISPSIQDISQYTRQDLIGKSLYDIYANPGERDKLIQNIMENGKVRDFEIIMMDKDGSQVACSIVSALVKDEMGKPIKIVGSMRDITQRKQIEKELNNHRDHLEEMVEERTEELQKVNKAYMDANKELKEFAYIVSHDLKAPLRAISQLTHWISEDYSHAFDDDGKLQMELIIKRVRRMDGLIDGILRYSRVGRIREKEERLDLNLLVSEVIGTIAPPKNIRVIFENKLPVVLRDSIRMEQVFQNLIENAVKYMDKDEGIIKVGCESKEMLWEFNVSDNGPGIDKKYHDKIFQIFQTLAPRDEHESTGIGLTLVKKIIELYGGSIWIESEPGVGTRFYFSLPKKGEKNETLKTYTFS